MIKKLTNSSFFLELFKALFCKTRSLFSLIFRLSNNCLFALDSQKLIKAYYSIEQRLPFFSTNQADWLAVGWKLAGGWLAAGWRLAGGWLAAGRLVVDDDFNVKF